MNPIRPIESILVGIDFSPSSRVALDDAVRIAFWSGSSVRATHVIDRSLTDDLRKLRRHNVAFARMTMHDINADWAEFARGVNRGASVPFDVRIDDRTSGLLRSVENESADLVVVGTQAAESDRRRSDGIVSACIENSSADVLVVRAARSGKFRRILAAIDFSDASARVAQQAVHFASQEGAQLIFVHLSEAPWTGKIVPGPTIEGLAHHRAENAKLLRQRLVQLTQPWVEVMPAAKIEWRIEVDDEHRAGMSAIATEVDADLVVLGARGPSTMRDRLIGSTCERMLRHTQSCVLAVKPSKVARTAEAA